MYKFLIKNGQILAFGLGVLIIVIFLIFVVFNMGEFIVMVEEKQMEIIIFDFGLYGVMVLVVIVVVVMVIFGLVQVVISFKSFMKGILGFVVLLVVFFVFYFMMDIDISLYIQGVIDKFE